MNNAFFSLALLAILTAPVALAQISYTSGNYTQNFDGLANTGTGITWTNNSTLPGWFSDETDYDAGTGSLTTGSLYSFGAASASDRALGSLASGGTGTNLFGLALRNAGASTLTSFTLSYDGEQWRRNDNDPQRTEFLQFSYQIFNTGAGSINGGTWTTVSALNFTSPNATLTTASALDGNASANRTANITSTVSSISWGAGQDLWIRWSDINSTGNDHGLAVDNLTFSSVPEPSVALSLLSGFGLLALLRRRVS